MKITHLFPPIILSVFVSGCLFLPQKKPHVYHLLGNAEQSAQKQASVLAQNIPLEQETRRWKLMGSEKGKTYYLDVSTIFHHADTTTRMSFGDRYIHVKPYNSGFVKIQNQDGSYDIDSYNVACYENLFEKYNFGKYTADHHKRKLATNLTFFINASNIATYINEKNINKIDAQIAKEMCLLAPNKSFFYPNKK